MSNKNQELNRLFCCYLGYSCKSSISSSWLLKGKVFFVIMLRYFATHRIFNNCQLQKKAPGGMPNTASLQIQHANDVLEKKRRKGQMQAQIYTRIREQQCSTAIFNWNTQRSSSREYTLLQQWIAGRQWTHLDSSASSFALSTLCRSSLFSASVACSSRW